MTRLLISLIFLFLTSCKSTSQNNLNLKNIVGESTKILKEKVSKTETVVENNNNNLFYYIGDPYFIQGVEYIPKENYNYIETGLASFYGKELHNVKTINNDINKVTELLGRHKTLPIPSIVKVTNLENGLFLTVKIIDRHEDNSTIIQVSRKVAQLLRFYKNKITRVKVEILSDPSKQWKNVTLAMNEPKFNDTISSAPTDIVSISNLDDINNHENDTVAEIPIEIGSEPIENNDLYLKVYNFKSYEEIQKIINEINLSLKTTTENQGSKYNLIIGPINNEDANLLVSTFIMKGYKQTEIIIK